MQETPKEKARGGETKTVRVGRATVPVYVNRHSTGRTRYRVVDSTAGKRRFREFFNQGNAFKEARRLAGLLNRGEELAAAMTRREAGDYGKATEILRSTGVSISAAVSAFAEAFRILGEDRVIEAARYFAERRPDKVVERKVEAVVKEFLEQREARGCGYWYMGDMRRRLGTFASAFQCPIASVTTPLVQAWLDGLEVAPRTLLNFRRAVSTLFAFAETRGYVTKGSNPVRDTERVSGKTSEPVTIFSAADCAGILEAASPEALPVLALCAFAGVRVAEALRLDWRSIDLAGGYIEVGADKSKVKTRRLVPVLPALKAWLGPIAKKEGPIWKGSPLTFTRHQGNAAKAAGVKWQQNGFRHTWISARLALTHDAAKVALEAGNSPAMIFAHYRELLKPDQAEAWFAVRPEAEPTNVVRLERRAA